MSANKGTSGAIEGLVYDFYVLAIEGILQERRGILSPLGTTSTENYSDNSDYNRQSLLPWRRDVNRLLILDLYMFSTKHNKHVLLERWKINYQRNNDSKDFKPFPIINRRILTLVRTIICFIRLLPGFNLLNLSKVKPSLGYQIYEGRNEDGLPKFSYDCLKYRFSQVSTSKGFINIGVTYVNPSSTKDLIRSVNNNSGGQQRNSKDSEKSAAIPIPISRPSATIAVPDYPISRHRHSASYEHQQRIDEYEDQFDSNNSSYSAAIAMNTHREDDGHQRRQQQQQADDLRRRSLHQPYARGHSNSEEGPSLKVRANHQQAVSLDHYNSKHSLLGQHYPFESSPPVSSGSIIGGGTPLGSMPSISPSSATASVQYLQSHRPQVSPSMGMPQGKGQQQHHNHNPPYTGSNASSQSTPPFSLLDHRVSDMSTYPDPTKASPPYPQFSTSLVSTSPASLNPSELAIRMGAVRSNYRRKSFSDRNNSASASAATSWQQQPMQVAASPENPSEELHLLMTLPRSPFMKLLSTEGTENPPSTSDSNRLDVILYEEKRQLQLQQANGWSGGVEDNPSKYLFGRSAASKCAGGVAAAAAGEADYTDESSRQFRLSDEQRGRGTQQLDFGDIPGGVADRNSLSCPQDGEEEEDEEEEDMMFAFALNPHEFAGNSDMDHLSPSVPSSLNGINQVDSNGPVFTAAGLKAEMQARLNVFKNFIAEMK